VAKLHAAALELGERAIPWTGREIRTGVDKQWLGAQRLKNFDGVILPIGGDVQIASRRKSLGESVHERALKETPLMMSLLRPGIGEENVCAGKGSRREHVQDDFDGVVLDDADVGKTLLLDELEQSADAGTVDFDREKIIIGTRFRDRCRRLTHAKAYFEDLGRRAAEDAVKIDRGSGKRNAEARQKRFVRALLSRGEAPLTQHETSDRAVTGRRRRSVDRPQVLDHHWP